MQPWKRATGPRTPEGKRRAAANGRGNAPHADSVRTAQRDVVLRMGLFGQMMALCRSLG